MQLIVEATNNAEARELADEGMVEELLVVILKLMTYRFMKSHPKNKNTGQISPLKTNGVPPLKVGTIQRNFLLNDRSHEARD